MSNTYPARFNKIVECVADIDPVGADEELECNWGNPQACANDNELRARFAGVAVQAYAKRTGGSESEEPETVIGDLLNDLRHLCDALDIRFEALVENDTNYQAELLGEF